MKKIELIGRDPAPLPHGVKKEGTVILTGKVIKTSEGRVLETDVYVGGIIEARHFTHRNGYWTCAQGKWSRERLNSVLDPYYGWGRKWVFIETTGYAAAAKEYFGGGICTAHIRSYVGDAEREIRYEKQMSSDERKRTRLKRETDAITPALPRDFQRFVKKHMPKNGQHIGIQLYQKLKAGQQYVERQFRIENRNGKLVITEEARGIADHPGGMWISWLYGRFYGNYGIRQTWWNKKGGSCVNFLQRRFLLYTGNTAELGLSERQAELLKEISKIAPECEWSFILRMIGNGRIAPVEHMLAAGLTTAAREFVSCTFYEAHTDDSRKNLHGYFKITPQQLSYLREINGGWRSVYFLQKDTEGILRPKQLELLEKNVSIRNLSNWKAIIARHRLPIAHVVKLLGDRSGKVKTGILYRYEDYLGMAAERGADVHDEIIYRNKRWEEYHDRYVEELNARRAAEQAKKRRDERRKKAKKFAGIRKDYQKNMALFSWENGGYCIEVPRTYEDIIMEGQLQHHCVGATDTYMERMSKRQSFILFLRRAADREKPYYTIEATTKEIKQYYAEYDRQPDKEEVKKILSRWMKQVRRNAAAMEKGEGNV